MCCIYIYICAVLHDVDKWTLSKVEYIYEGWSKSPLNVLIFIKLLTLLSIETNHLLSTLLQHIHTYSTFPAIVGKMSGSPFFHNFKRSVVFALMSSLVTNCLPFNVILSLGNSQKSHGAKSGEYGGCGTAARFFPAMNCWTSSEECEGVIWDQWRHQGKHNRPLKVVEERRLPDMFPTVAGKVEQVCMCWRRALWRWLVSKRNNVSCLINIDFLITPRTVCSLLYFAFSYFSSMYIFSCLIFLCTYHC